MDITFGQWLRLRREAVGGTQESLGKKLGLSDRTVLRWEKGGGYPKLTPQDMMKLCCELGISFDDLVRACYKYEL